MASFHSLSVNSKQKKLGSSNSLVENCNGNNSKRSEYDCPVCMCYLLPPIYQCTNGHTLCNECESKLNCCPVCRDELSKQKKIRCLVLEKIVVDLTFNCRNREQGCLVSLKYNEIQEHGVQCQFIELPICPYLGIKCVEKYSTYTVLKHLKNNHGLQGINFDCNDNENDIAGSGNGVSIPVQIQQSVEISKLKRRFKPTWIQPFFKFQGQHFFLLTNFDNNDHVFTWSVSRLESNPAMEGKPRLFTAKIKLRALDSGTNYLKWQGQVSEMKQDIMQSTMEQSGEEKSKTGKTCVGFKKFRVSVSTLRELCDESRINNHNDSSCNLPSSTKGKRILASDELQWILELRLKELKQDLHHHRRLVSMNLTGEDRKSNVIVKSIINYDETPEPSSAANIVAERIRMAMARTAHMRNTPSPQTVLREATRLQSEIDLLRRIQGLGRRN